MPKLLTHGLLWLLALGPPLAAAQAPPDSVLQALAARATSLPPTLAALDSANGFGAYHFGTPVAELPEPLAGLVVLKHDQVGCVAPGAAANIGGLLLPGLRLTAYEGRLARISFGPTSEQYAETLLHILQRHYGPGRNVGYMRYQWLGRVVTLVFEPLIVPNRSMQGGNLSMSSSNSVILGTAYLQSNALAAEARAARKRPKPDR